jgi:outer membrane protein assembly factor BamB
MTRNVRMYNPTHRYDTTGESGPTDSPTVQWSYELDTDTHRIAVWDGQVYVTAKDGSISVFDTDGNPQWRFQTDGFVKSSPAVVDGTVYVGSNDGHVYAIDASSGTEQWSFQTDGYVDSSPVVKDGRVYVGGDTVYALGSNDTETKLFERCSACQTDLNDYADPAFCPECGANLSDSQGETQIYDPD